jgi:hypothetical protein
MNAYEYVYITTLRLAVFNPSDLLHGYRNSLQVTHRLAPSVSNDIVNVNDYELDVHLSKKMSPESNLVFRIT